MTPAGNDIRPRPISSIERWDPLAFVFAAHGLGLVIAGSTRQPLAIAVVTGVLAVVRLAVAWFPRPYERPGTRLALGFVSIILVFAVVILDGGTESPFFFWVLLLLGWQALTFRQKPFTILAAATLGAYLVVLMVAMEWSAAAIARLGLLTTFILTIYLGRAAADRQDHHIRHLENTVTSVIDDVPVAVAVFGADRDTLLFANDTAHRIGITDHDSMARLILSKSAHPVPRTLAELVVGTGFADTPPRTFHPIGQPDTVYQIGYHARRLETSDPIVVVYGYAGEGATEG